METEETLRVAEVVFTTLADAAGFPARERDWSYLVEQWQKSRSMFPMVEASVQTALKIQGLFKLTPLYQITKN